jgi:thiol-disulfide isomerase/thioredoxin
MKLSSRTWLLLAFALPATAIAQSSLSPDQFRLNGEIIGRDTGSVILWSVDNRNFHRRDTLVLKEGKFSFDGTVFRACEALLWTKLNLTNFDDPLVIRFLIGPGEISIVFDPEHPADTKITGSAIQSELDRHNITRKHELDARKRNYEDIDKFYALPESKRKKAVELQIAKTRDSIFTEIRKIDVAYIWKNPGSFLSPYLLSHHRRRLPADSLAVLYDNLHPDVKQSSVAMVALKDIYPIVDDPQFRAANPLMDPATEAAVAKMKSVHELSLPDTSGKLVSLAAFRGKYLFLDFWASWCKPCIEEIPSLHRLMDIYRGDNIQFLSVSLDHDSIAWKKAIAVNKYEGLHVYDKKAYKSVVAIFNRALWVPWYVLIDPEGKAIDYGTPFPSNPELKRLLDEILKKAGS